MRKSCIYILEKILTIRIITKYLILNLRYIYSFIINCSLATLY